MMEKNAIINCIFIILFCYKVAAENDKSGPYKSVMLNASRCEKPSLPYEEKPSVVFFCEVYNSTKKSNLIRGNITILNEYSNYKIKSKSYVLEDGQWKISLVANSAGCRGVMLTLFTSILGLDYDKEKCLIKKGTYSFSDVNTNQIEHAWSSTKIYGSLKTRVEVSAGVHTVECWEFNEIVVPIR